jgi:predicted site-specific integrase-resolvase
MPTIKCYNERELAVLLGLSVKTLQKWRGVGSGPAYIKLGSRVVYNDDDVAAFVAANMRLSTRRTGKRKR